ncbi:MAG: tRNA (guanosine(37)-N1)-methyltransferase TrmD [Parachlamydiales bacterium]|nr:tRNA (guanosine(37)-N1)-methyltransferase TrmD [Parachlamydiales bacterium]
MLIDILSLFPEYFESPLNFSIMKRAIEDGIITIRLGDIRIFSHDKHKKVDDRPYGGGPGMVLAPQPVVDAIRSVKSEHSRVIYLSPQGKKLNAALCKDLAKEKHLVFLCGHYEGIDERIMKEVDEEISIGDYVLTNGCAAAVVAIDALMRFIPGVLGDLDSAKRDSFEENMFACPQYTRPEVFEGVCVPSVLLNGNHQEIEKWRKQKGLEKTKRVRPDIYTRYLLEQVITNKNKEKVP